VRRKRERERERGRHASRSPMILARSHDDQRSATNDPNKTESPGNASKAAMPPSLAGPSYHMAHGSHHAGPGPSSVSVSMSRTLPGLAMPPLYGQPSYDPFRDALRGLGPESMLWEPLDREAAQRADFLRMAGAGANPFGPGPPGSLAANLYHERFREMMSMGASDRYRDALSLPPHFASSFGALSDPRFRDGLMAMAGPASMYPPVSTSFQFPPSLGGPGLLD